MEELQRIKYIEDVRQKRKVRHLPGHEEVESLKKIICMEPKRLFPPGAKGSTDKVSP